MQSQDSEQELLEVAEALEEADDSFRRGNYAKAEPIYHRALELMEARYGGGDPDTIVCLQKLGDTYYAMRQYDEALPLYRRLLVIGEKILGKNHPDVVAMAIKLGTTYEKMDMTEDAAAMYQRAQKLSQSSLVALRSMPGNDDDAEAQAKRGRVVDPRKLTGNFLDNAVDVEHIDLADPPKPVSWKADAKKESKKEKDQKDHKASFNRSRPGAQKKANDDTRGAMMYMLQQNSAAIAGGAALLVLILFGAFVFTKLSTGEHHVVKVPVKEHFHKQVFSTADGITSIVLQSPEEAVMVLGSGQMQSSTKLNVVQMGPAWDDFADLIIGTLINKEYWYEKVPEGLRTEAGGVLYSRESPEGKVLAVLGKVANKAQLFYQVNHTYPTQEQSFAELAYQNPFSFKTEYPTVLEYVSPSPSAGGLSSDGSNDDVIFSTLQRASTGQWQKEHPPSPCVIHTLTVQKGYTNPPSSEFYAHGYDRNGQLLRADQGDQVFIYAFKNGVSQLNSHFPAPPKFNGRPVRICIVKVPPNINLVLLHHIVPITLFALALLFFTSSQLSKPKDEFMSQFTILDRVAVVFLLLSIVWAIAAVLP